MGWVALDWIRIGLNVQPDCLIGQFLCNRVQRFRIWHWKTVNIEKKIFFGKIFIWNDSYRSFPRRFFIILGIGFISRKSRGWRSEICSHERRMSPLCQGDICVTLTEWTVLMLIEPFANALFAKSMLAIWCIQWIFKHTFKIILYTLYDRAYYMPHISISL